MKPGTPWGVWDGWGCSLCWWANQFGQRDDLADALFTTGSAGIKSNVGTYAVPGLGLNMARYNIGGTSDAPALGKQPLLPDKMPAFKHIQGFWLDGDTPATAFYDWTRDANQRAMLQKARDRGANRLLAFSDSPMWWMCRNLSTAGSEDGGDNLQPRYYDTFTEYLVAVARTARDRWGVDFESIEPFNEPMAYWWKYPGGQEGCHFAVSTQAEIIGRLRTKLDDAGLQTIGICASDENSVDTALATWSALDDASRNAVSQVSTHGYYGLRAYRGANRKPLHQAVSSAGKALWMTEYGESDGSGQTMAQSILLDINEMRATAWIYWQPFDSGGWGLVQCNPGDNWIGPANPKWYVMAQFSRHIRPGMTMLDTDAPNTVAAYEPATGKLIAILVNGPEERSLTLDLSQMANATGPASHWATSFDGTALYRKSADAPVHGKRLTVRLVPDSVHTFELNGVRMEDITRTPFIEALLTVQDSGGLRASSTGNFRRVVRTARRALGLLPGS